MKGATSQRSTSAYLEGGGEMGALTRAYDWDTTPLGNPESWPQSLLQTLSNLLRSPFPGFLWWGKDFLQFYNDGYRRALDGGNLHPMALGKKGREYWKDRWNTLGPMLHKVLNGEALWQENHLITQSGNDKSNSFWSFSYSPVLDETGQPGGVLVTCLETTKEVLARKKFEASESRLRSIIATAHVGIAVFSGPDLVLESPNQTFIDIAGKGWDIEGKPFREAFPELVNDPQSRYPVIKKVLATGIPFSSPEIQVKREHDGRTKEAFYNLAYTPLKDADGNVTDVLCIAFDITEQVRSRQQLEETDRALRNAIELAELASWSLDIGAGTFTYSQRFMDWLGFSEDTKDLDGAYNPLPDAYRESVPAAINAAIAKGSSGTYENEHPIINRLTGQVRIIQAKAEVSYDQAGNPRKLAGTALDITELRLREEKLEKQVAERTNELASAIEALRNTNKELQRSNDHLEEFAHAASHDLKEPIRKIQVFTGQLTQRLDGQLADADARLLERIENASERMGLLVEDLLQYSHVSQHPHEKEDVDLMEVVQQVLHDLEVMIDRKQALITYQELPRVWAYRRQLQQLLQNLVSNALKYSKDDVAPKIRISAFDIHEGGNDYQSIVVEDEGIGFDQEYAEKIFQMFTRLHSKQEYEGTGIGLAIVKKVVENHEGRIRVSSRKGEGSSFTIMLPVRP